MVVNAHRKGYLLELASRVVSWSTKIIVRATDHATDSVWPTSLNVDAFHRELQADRPVFLPGLGRVRQFPPRFRSGCR